MSADMGARDMSEAHRQLQISVLWRVRSNMLAEGHFSGCTKPRKKATGPWSKGPGPPQGLFLQMLARRGLSPNSKWTKLLAGLDKQSTEAGPGGGGLRPRLATLASRCA